MILDEAATADQLRAAIEGADAIVQQYLAGAGISDTLLTEIERWLAAHLVTISRIHGGVRSFSRGDQSETYIGDDVGSGLGMLQSTRHGRTAVSMDPSGRLANLGKPKAIFSVM